jgi:hypothetical protein
MRRLLVTVALAIGLFGMHGLAAPSATAGHCGSASVGAAPSAHHAGDHAKTAGAPGTPERASLVLPSPSGGPDGLWLSCLALLAAAAFIAAARRLALRLDAPASGDAVRGTNGPAGRAPPARTRPEDTCVWRT